MGEVSARITTTAVIAASVADALNAQLGDASTSSFACASGALVIFATGVVF